MYICRFILKWTIAISEVYSYRFSQSSIRIILQFSMHEVSRKRTGYLLYTANVGETKIQIVPYHFKLNTTLWIFLYFFRSCRPGYAIDIKANLKSTYMNTRLEMKSLLELIMANEERS